MTMLLRRLAVTLVLTGMCAVAPRAAAQAQPPAPAPQTPAPATPAPAGQAPAQPAPAPAYSYQAEGRRDPFVSLLGRNDPNSMANRPSGLAGVLIDEMSLKGIVKTRTGFMAWIQAADKKMYSVQAGDKLMDGTVKSITADSVVFSQDVNDPLSTVKQREKIKKLRSNEEGRE
jgi:Tfp pilus assembly protein PilP